MVEVYWFSEQPYGHVGEEDLAAYESGRMHFPNTNFDPEKAPVLYHNYHEQYAWADEVGFDGIMSNEQQFAIERCHSFCRALTRVGFKAL